MPFLSHPLTSIGNLDTGTIYRDDVDGPVHMYS